MAHKYKSKLWEWQNRTKEGGICAKCGIQTSYLTVDHIVPTSVVEMLDETGLAIFEDEDNFQMLCQPCNRLKGNKLDKRNSMTKIILTKLLL